MASRASRRRRTTAVGNPAASRVTMYSVAKPRIAIPATFMGPINTPRPAIPSELYRNIIEWVADTQDLCNLSLTSRICCTEAQRILYRVVDLAQNTRAPVLWASTILEHPRRAEAVRALTLRFDLSFLIVPDMMLSPLELISRALRTLRKLEKLVLVGHPKVMMHPIHSWILDGCTAHLNVFHNFVFPASSIIPFLSRQPNLRQWTQMGVFHGEIIRDTLMPQLTELDVHASALPCFTTPRPLVRVRLKIDDHGGREKTWERKAIQSLALFGSTLSTLIIEHSSISNHLAPVEVFGVLIEATPNLKTLVYTLMSNLDEDTFSQACMEHLSRFPKLGILALYFKGQLCVTQDRMAMAKRAFERCPPLQCVVMRDNTGHSYARREDILVAEGNDAGVLSSGIRRESIKL